MKYCVEGCKPQDFSFFTAVKFSTTALIAGSYRMVLDSFSLYKNQIERITVPEKKVIMKLVNELKIQDLNEKFIEF